MIPEAGEAPLSGKDRKGLEAGGGPPGRWRGDWKRGGKVRWAGADGGPGSLPREVGVRRGVVGLWGNG